MTIGVAWIRKGSYSDELWLASDSRLSGDENIWDDCPKLLLLPRRDAVAAFSGTTAQAYPLMLQIYNAISSYRAAADGTLEFTRLMFHLEQVANAMMDGITRDPAIIGADNDRPEFATSGDTLILGGYSRFTGTLAVRSLRYLPSVHRWAFVRARPRTRFGRGRIIVLFGDESAKSRFGYILKMLLDERGILDVGRTFDHEPLEALARMLRMPVSTSQRLPMGYRPATTGGVPQIARVIPGATATPIAVLWESNEGNAVYLQGRKTFSYENLDVPLAEFNGSSPTFYAPSHWPQSAIRSQIEVGDNLQGEPDMG